MDTTHEQDRARSARRDTDGPRRAELLTAASECFAIDGYDRTTAATIAARAGTSRPTFYAYFASKDRVFHALTQQVCDALVAAQLVVDVDAASAREVLAATTRAYAEAIYANAPLVALIEQRAGIDPEVGALWTAVRDRTTRRFVRFLEQLDAAGTIDPAVSPARIVDAVADGILIGAARLAGAPESDRERFIVEYIAITERLVGVA